PVVGHVHCLEVVRPPVGAAQFLDRSSTAAAADNRMAKGDELVRHGPAEAARDARDENRFGFVSWHEFLPIVGWVERSEAHRLPTVGPASFDPPYGLALDAQQKRIAATVQLSLPPP